MNLREYDVSNPFAATLLSSQRITPEEYDTEVRHLVLQVPHQDFAWVEGQSIGILTPGPHEFGNKNHLRLYSIASPQTGEQGKPDTLSICVRRCFYIDDISGERYPGKASNYLCDAKEGAAVQITGPYGAQFALPPDDSCNLLMIGVGTGIAPFRAFVRRIYDSKIAWTGKVRLFYGAKTGTELVYRNDVKKDLGLYYDDRTFQAFEAVSPRPYLDAPPALDELLIAHAREIWEMIENPKTYVYLSGLMEAEQKFEKAMAVAAGSERAWVTKRGELIAKGRYSELLYQ